jgi:hypothetical protein
MNGLTPEITPHERMAEIRLIVREVVALAAAAKHCESPEQADDIWDDYSALVTLLIEHLGRAEARGELGECEGFLSVSYGGRA